MSGAGSGSPKKSVNGDALGSSQHRSSSPAARVVTAKGSSSSLSSQLSAHLAKPVAPRQAPPSALGHGTSSTSTTEKRGPLGLQQSGKAEASAADAEELGNSELWKSNAAKRAEKAWALQSEKSLQNDAKFKKYTYSVEKCLATFESVSEWADFIAFLGRLLKTFQLSPTFNAIPRKLTVAKRLSQCLNPALPSGVHQRALDVYEHILVAIGREGLRRDLLVWTPGLLPFFQYASTSVKPIVLGIFERHFLTIGQDLRPITRALLLAILPGLEEESTEIFDRVLRLLDRTMESVGQPFLLQNLFLVMISTPTARLPTLNYLAKRLPKLNGDDDITTEDKSKAEHITSIVGSNLGLLTRGFAAALEDDTFLLVRRASLDLLVTHLRLDSTIWKDLVNQDDKIRLVKAAIAVVLRRDLSLNRRLYAWILGSSEEIPTQQRYFEEHAQELSRLALLSELARRPLLDVSSSEREKDGIERQKPFKIFVSLLDKWSIGQPLTNSLVLDTFEALRYQLAGIDNGNVQQEAGLKSAATDISTTAKMLFEVVDPFTTYRQFFLKIKDEMGSTSTIHFSSISLLQFVLRSFRVHDEESRQIHLPVLFSVILEQLSKCDDKQIKGKAIELAGAILYLIPKRVFTRTTEQSCIEGSFLDHASTFYQSDSYNADDAAQRYIGFHHPKTQSKMLNLCAEATHDEEVQTLSLHMLSQMLRVFASATDSSEDGSSRIDWNARSWVQETLSMLMEATTFDQVEAYINVLLKLATCKALLKLVSLSKRDVAAAVYRKLFYFLHPSWMTCHVRAVELLWRVFDLAKEAQVEVMLCTGILSDKQEERNKTRDILAAIWQYSPEERLAHRYIKEPLLCILDGLRSSIWTEKQACEKWLKSNLRGYTLYLDPLLEILVEAKMTRQVIKVDGPGSSSLSFYQYCTPFDHERVLYALNMILHLIRFGAQSMIKSMRSTLIHRCHYPSIVSFYTAEDETEKTYLRGLISTLLLYLQADCRMNESYAQVYSSLYTNSAEILQALMLRGPLPASFLNEIEDALLDRIYISVQRGNLAIQNCLLQTLYGVIRAKTSEGAMRDNQPKSLLLISIKDALSRKSNRSALSYWTDFVLNMIPHYRKALTSLLLRLNEIVCQCIVAAVAELQEGYQVLTDAKECEMTDADLILLMNINERLLLQCLEAGNSLTETNGIPKSNHAIAPSSSSEKSDSAGILGAFNSVFPVNDTTTMSTAIPTTSTSNSILNTLHHTIRSLHVVWASSGGEFSDEDMDEARQRSLEVINPKIRARCRRSLERIYRNNSGEVVESLVDCWSIAGGVKHLQQTTTTTTIRDATIDLQCINVTFEILSTLAPSAQIVVTFLCDVISSRTTLAISNSSDKGSQKKGFTPIVSESTLMYFWEAYLDRLDAAAMMQVWPVVIMLIRDILHNSAVHKLQMYPLLRCFTVTGEKLFTGNSTNEDKRIKREFVDAYIRLCDYNILIAGRSFEQTNWIGRRVLTTGDEGSIEEEGQATPTTTDDKMIAASIGDVSLTTGSSGGSSSSLIESTNEYLCHRVLPALRKYTIEQDKVINLCTNIVYYIITPALRLKKRTFDIPHTILLLLTEVTKMPGTVRAWKNAVVDIFQDVRFFQLGSKIGLQCLPIILTLMNSDKERMVELIAKVTSSPSTNIFTNKEAETIIRSTNLRRITTVIYAAERDHWLTQLPPLQEKLVELLRNGASDSIGSDVYLCLRVLLVRFSPRHLSAFWPVIITELIRLFEECVEEGMPMDESDTLQLLLSACKFLDLLFTLQTNDFQLHQWLFITDTVDVVEPPQDWKSESILDRMAVIIGRKGGGGNKMSLSQSSNDSKAESKEGSGASVEGDSVDLSKDGETSSSTSLSKCKRRPRLVEIGSSISKVDQLLPFFSSISRYIFQQTFDCGETIDWQAVASFIEGDIFPQ